jgi:hypothetical protein
MASGHVNRIQRPNTWLHRPMLQNVKKALANTEPSTHGTFRTSRDVRLASGIRTKVDVRRSPEFPWFLTACAARSGLPAPPQSICPSGKSGDHFSD